MRRASMVIVWLALAANTAMLVENARTMATVNRLREEADLAMVEIRRNAATVERQLWHPCYQGMNLQPGERCSIVVPIPEATPNP